MSVSTVNAVLSFAVIASLIVKISGLCDPKTKFECYSGYCIRKDQFCNGNYDCTYNGLSRVPEEDEAYCNLRSSGRSCPVGWFKCGNYRCIPPYWKCDGDYDCTNGEDEVNCEPPEETARKETKEKLITWFKDTRKGRSSINKWGYQLPRAAVALYLGDQTLFNPGAKIGEEMGYELVIQLLSRLTTNKTIKSNELAMYINALLVTCISPRDFYGHDLISQLRAVVSKSNHNSPFDYLVLCNAGDQMTSKDVEKLSAMFDSETRPFWTDNQAMVAMAVACISSRTDVSLDERTLIEMGQELKRHQFRNGTVENLKTTALVIQALTAIESIERDFDLKSAREFLIKNQKSDGSIGSYLESYYALPALSNTNLGNINTSHCKLTTISEEEALSDFARLKGDRMYVQYSVWFGTEKDLRKTWTLRMPINCTLYSVIETACKLDTSHRVQYNVINGKPYVSSLVGYQEDIETGQYWYQYVREQKSNEEPKLLEDSPVDIQIVSNQEIILWYTSKNSP